MTDKHQSRLWILFNGLVPPAQDETAQKLEVYRIFLTVTLNSGSLKE